ASCHDFCLRTLYFSTLLRPPRPTLFPYTTLFRSGRLLQVDALAAALGQDFMKVGTQAQRIELLQEGGAIGARGDHDQAGVAGKLDRKSTRLNSSHRTISYAVFCLKKKKKQRI